MIKEKIIKLYLKDKKSINDISKETNVSEEQVRGILIENQIIKTCSNDEYSSNESKQFKLGWVISEKIGIGIFNTRGIVNSHGVAVISKKTIVG